LVATFATREGADAVAIRGATREAARSFAPVAAEAISGARRDTEDARGGMGGGEAIRAGDGRSGVEAGTATGDGAEARAGIGGGVDVRMGTGGGEDTRAGMGGRVEVRVGTGGGDGMLTEIDGDDTAVVEGRGAGNVDGPAVRSTLPVRSAAARPILTTRSTLPSFPACSAARRSHRAASLNSPRDSSARAVWSASRTSSESEESGLGVCKVKVALLTLATIRKIPF
jgi:hypothetical protein